MNVPAIKTFHVMCPPTLRLRYRSGRASDQIATGCERRDPKG